MDNKLRTMRTQHMRSGNAIFGVIRRSFLLAGLCILTDVAIGLLVKVTHVKFPEAIFAPLAMYDINLIVNLLCIIATFRDVKVMLFPWLYFFKSGKESSLQSRSFQNSIRKQSMRENLELSGRRPSSTRETRKNLSIGTQDCEEMLKLKRDQVVEFDENQEQFLHQECVVVSVNEEAQNFLSERANLESLGSERNEDVESEMYHHSDTILHYPKHQSYPQKRSASLNLTSNISMPILRRAKSHLIISFINKSKSWLMDHKPF